MQNHVNFVILMFKLFLFLLSVLPSWMVKAIGLRVKSGWLFPSGSVSVNCVIITPGTLDFFLIPTVSNWKSNVSENTFDTLKVNPRKHYETIMKNMTMMISSLQNLFFCNQIIIHINHAETHSNTWRIRMLLLLSLSSFGSTQCGSGVDGFLVSMFITFTFQ